jgi:hypothetical protein
VDYFYRQYSFENSGRQGCSFRIPEVLYSYQSPIDPGTAKNERHSDIVEQIPDIHPEGRTGGA